MVNRVLLFVMCVSCLIATATGTTEIAWTMSVGDNVTCTDCTEGGDLYFVGTNHKILCLNKNKSQNWEYSVNDPVMKLQCARDGSKVIAMTARHIHCLDSAGNVKWVHQSSNNDHFIDMYISPDEGSTVATTQNIAYAWTGDGDIIGSPLPAPDPTNSSFWSHCGIDPQEEWLILTSGPKIYQYNKTYIDEVWLNQYLPWKKRVPITISNPLNTGNCSVNFTLPHLTGMQSDFTDIRFATCDGTPISYWIKSYNGTAADIFLELPFSDLTEIYCYYNNPSAADDSEDSMCPVMFQLFRDDFDELDTFNGTTLDYTWNFSYDTYPKTQFTATNGLLECNAPGDQFIGSGIESQQEFNNCEDLEIIFKCNSTYRGLTKVGFAGYENPMYDDGYEKDIVHNSFLSALEYSAGIVNVNFSNPYPGGYVDPDNTSLSNSDHNHLYIVSMDQSGMNGYPTRIDWIIVRLNNTPIPIFTLGTPQSMDNPSTMQGYYHHYDNSLKSYKGNIQAIDIPERGNWIGVLTDSQIYHQEISTNNFETTYNTAAPGSGYDIAISDQGVFSIEGRSIYTNLYFLDCTKTGTYSTGGNVKHVAIARKTSLWAVAGSDDGKIYVFSKDSSSNWYLDFSSDSYNPVTALSMAAKGEYILAGRQGGMLTLYKTSTKPPSLTTPFWFSLYVLKDGKKYEGADIKVYQYHDEVWDCFEHGPVDSEGKYVVQLVPGNRYKFVIGDDEKIIIWDANPTQIAYYVNIISGGITTTVDYSCKYNSETKAIEFQYSDTTDTTDSVTVTIYRTDTYDIVFERVFDNSAVEDSYSVIEGDNAPVSYKVEMMAERQSGTLANHWFISPSGFPIKLPLGTDMTNIIFCCFLMFVAGLFGYADSSKGALFVAFFAMFFAFVGWITIPWYWLTAAVVIAILAGMAHRR